MGTAGFILYLLYDINSVKQMHPVMQKFFGAGSLCVILSTVWELVRALGAGNGHPAAWIGLGVGGALFFALLVYTLFFALPFEETYLEESRRREAYTGGIYSLCRHPGVLWFAGLYLCLWGITGNADSGKYFLSMILWNYLYIVVQDLWTFPRTFTNYEAYKKNTPFLIPNGKSIRTCAEEIHKRNGKKRKGSSKSGGRMGRGTAETEGGDDESEGKAEKTAI